MTENKDEAKEPEKEPLDDEALEKLAVEELMREAVQGAARAEIVGPSGWIKPSGNKSNKRFLANTIRNAVSSNNYYNSRKSRPSHKHSSKRSPKRERHSDRAIKKDTSKRKN